jgi:hypothetical protein
VIKLDIPQIDARRRPEEEALLDEKIRTEWGTGPENYPAEDWRGVRENARLMLLYPDKVLFFRGRISWLSGISRQARIERFWQSHQLQ